MNYFGSEHHKKNAKNASIIGLKKIEELKNQRIEKYYSNPKICLSCNKPINYEKRNNKFCSSSCSAKHNNKKRTITDKQKLKTSLNLMSIEKGGNKILKEYKRICLFCNTEFIVNRNKNNSLSKKKFCSLKCSNDSMKMNVSSSMKKRVEKGIHKGWQSRNIESYPETFFKKVLENNNIKYEFNKIISKRSLGLDCDANYFLDFFIEDEKIDLEIDGKQHLYDSRIESDEIRDEYLSKNGIKVYRIKWKEIETNDGKEYIKNEIDKFLLFINAKKLKIE